jgi:pimeloyl-ACP methyl ester carboxylesterase
MSDDALEIVLLPGLDGSGALFQRLADVLSTDARVTVASYPADAKMQYDDYVQYARTIISNRRVVLLGESFSGPVAIKIAGERPYQIIGLVLASTFLASPWPSWIVRTVAALDLRFIPRAVKNFALMGSYRDRQLSDDVWAVVDALPRGVVAARLRDVAGVNVRTELESLRCPVLVLHGKADWLVSRITLDLQSAKADNFQFEFMPGPHMLLQTRPVQAAQQIKKFLQSLSR